MKKDIIRKQSLTESDAQVLVPLVAAGFCRDDDEHNYDDTIEHLCSADQALIMMVGGAAVGFATFRNLPDHDAAELSGLIISPDFQQRGFGLELVKKFVTEEKVRNLITQTRNPSTVAIVGKVAEKGDVLRYENPIETASMMPDPDGRIKVVEGVIYDINRYEEPLYGDGHDPAHRGYNGRPLDEQCPELKDLHNALAIRSEILGGKNG
jgi:predicted acetyltransferase